MRFGPPPEQADVSPWRWRVEPQVAHVGVRIIVALAACIFLACLAGEGRLSDPDGLRARPHDEGEYSSWRALLSILVLACVTGTAMVTVVRNLIMVPLAAVLAATVVRHAGAAHACGLIAPFGLLTLAVVIHVAIDVVMLRPVFAALRARRRLPRATVRRRR